MKHLPFHHIASFLVGCLLTTYAPHGWTRSWDSPEALLKHIVERSPAIQSTLTSAEATRLSSRSTRRAIGDTTLKAGVAALPVETRNGPNRAQFTLIQPLPQFRARAQRAAALMSQANAQQCRSSAQRLELKVQTLSTMMSIVAVREIRTVLHNLHQIAMDTLDTIVDQTAHDMANQSDILQAELVAEEIANEQVRASRMEAELVRSLKVLADDEDFELSAAASQTLKSWMEGLKELVPEDSAVDEHPRLAVSTHRVEAFEHAAQSSRSRMRPKAAFMAKWSIITDFEQMSAPREGRDALLFGLSVTLPFANAEQRYASEAELVAADAERLSRQAMEESLRQEASRIYEQFVSAYQRWKHLRTSLVPIANQRVDALAVELAHGRSDYESLLTGLREQMRLKVEQWKLWEEMTHALAQLAGVTNGKLGVFPVEISESCNITAEEGKP